MRKIIHHIRNQPEEIRRHILHAITIIFGIVLLSIWVYSLGTNLNDPNTQAKMKNNLEPLSALKANIIGGYEGVSNPNESIQENNLE